MNLIEFFTDILLFWLPFYYVFKAGIIVWLMAPQTKGAEFVYARILRPFLIEKADSIDNELNKLKVYNFL